MKVEGDVNKGQFRSVILEYWQQQRFGSDKHSLQR